MEDNNDIIYCSRCGAEMKANSRYCMKCGNLNYDHPDNANMRQYISNNVNSYTVGSGQSILGNVPDGAVTQGIANSTGNPLLCFCLNFFALLFIVGGSILFFLVKHDFDVMSVFHSIIPVTALLFSIIFFYAYSMELIYMKTNHEWWSAVVPIYNNMVLAEITFNNRMLGLLALVPVVGFLFILVMFYKLGEKFGYNGWLSMFFFFIIIPMIAFGSHGYDGRTFVDPTVKNATEKEYGRKKIFLVTCFLFFAFGVAGFVYTYMNSLKETTEDIGKSYYKNATDKVISTTKDHINSGAITCDVDYNAANGVYYFYYGDVGTQFRLPLAVTRDPISAYVKVVNANGASQYYISMTDGTYGYPETLSDSVTTDTVVKHATLDFDSSFKPRCYLSEKDDD